jgi:hypothetical protein
MSPMYLHDLYRKDFESYDTNCESYDFNITGCVILEISKPIITLIQLIFVYARYMNIFKSLETLWN